MRTFGVFMVGAVATVAACASEGRAFAPADAGATAVDGAAVDAGRRDAARADAGLSFVDDGGRSGQMCERSIDVGALTLSSTACFVNEHVSHKSGKLSFPCDGGDASIDFGGKTFAGTVEGDVVDLALVEPFDFNACRWQSTETIRGDLSTSNLTYTYEEKPLANCHDLPCTAGGSLDVASGAVVVVK